MTDSSFENYPLTDEPTRESARIDDGETTGFSISEKAGESSEIPHQIGDYSIHELIGAGGMGEVYLAEHNRMKRAVAIKMLPIKRMKDTAAIERFYEEVRAASRLMHPNIVTAFDAGEADGFHYLAMEYVDGITLTKYISDNGPLSVGETASVIRQAAVGLLHAHRAGIVHRDIKPGNLMRALDGTVKILDLGLARISTAGMFEADGGMDEMAAGSGKKKGGGKLVGTLPFMSPEQLENADTVDSRTDIYSLGATMFFLMHARPPFTGKYLEQVYGHRHGEIPDLMQSRDDVDLKFANVFRRMMAKSPDQRYASFDEVIDDLGEYAESAATPLWLAEFNQRQAGNEMTTVSGGSTSETSSKVLAVDIGMFYSAAAEGSPQGGVELLSAGHQDRALCRMAVSSENDQLIYGTQALDVRAKDARRVVHCIPMYIGKQIVDREVAGRGCPPEVLLAMMLRRIKQNAWPSKNAPDAVAITIPASYDQLHRISMIQAAKMAGMESVRLVHRSIAAVQSMFADSKDDTGSEQETQVEPANEQNVLFVGVTGMATEVSVIRRSSNRLDELATAGHWHLGSLKWLHRLVDLAASQYAVRHGFDPRRKSSTASQLQIACERAMNSLLLKPSADIELIHHDVSKSVSVKRSQWLDTCEELIVDIRKSMMRACERASISLLEIDACVTMGPLLRIAAVRDAVLRGLDESVQPQSVDRADVARGAAACLAGELPGRGQIAMPPRCVTSQSIGIVVEDVKSRRRILPIIPQGTALPARTNRRLTVGKNRETMTLSLVESSGVASNDWQSLGRYDFEIDGRSQAGRTRMIGFEIDMNGILTVRAQTPGASGSIRLPTVPKPNLSDEELAEWKDWLDDLR